jgi:hypothetical protein
LIDALQHHHDEKRGTGTAMAQAQGFPGQVTRKESTTWSNGIEAGIVQLWFSLDRAG